ncbi:unnamed protein product [Cladocopium goreaui]|uniref:Uncharacterized protein n=1 Tax=Cladocopium goreaui TaxID=2562237 RepID=A0A9P1CNX1_9DINO|nr:unnamed protein product [Cladocopium goreaui]
MLATLVDDNSRGIRERSGNTLWAVYPALSLCAKCPGAIRWIARSQGGANGEFVARAVLQVNARPLRETVAWFFTSGVKLRLSQVLHIVVDGRFTPFQQFQKGEWPTFPEIFSEFSCSRSAIEQLHGLHFWAWAPWASAMATEIECRGQLLLSAETTSRMRQGHSRQDDLRLPYRSLWDYSAFETGKCDHT